MIFYGKSEFGGVTLSKEVGAIYLDRYLVYSKFLGGNYEEAPPTPKQEVGIQQCC